MAFAERGLTPRRAIRLERTRAAHGVLEADRGLTLDEVARRTGFPSARALRQALRTFGETGDLGLLATNDPGRA
ncbi:MULTISPECIES: hypothetical protein [unclassified Rathayibacter]|uniref:hypothetical protein n=1 Tax=unclassified Rathayibacter TaxID=2609250 RepID=UPI00188D5818|nr:MULTISPECIES: hypothetical protein [unclassified Rathayibacter]MBF4461353.1 hypothetical protein [Rathayibacter sp. VKM Ac-2879]MBF4502764.1 hypothetical protein [Rathayibacter sp. VKM Ac-2878]